MGRALLGGGMKVASKFQTVLIGKNLYIQRCSSYAAERMKSRSTERYLPFAQGMVHFPRSLKKEASRKGNLVPSQETNMRHVPLAMGG